MRHSLLLGISKEIDPEILPVYDLVRTSAAGLGKKVRMNEYSNLMKFGRHSNSIPSSE
jgi:tRNA A37 threonylcarbamoyladenosine dehydratase